MIRKVGRPQNVAVQLQAIFSTARDSIRYIALIASNRLHIANGPATRSPIAE
jgi:hypothetical protein